MARTKQTAKKSTGSKKRSGVSKKTKAAENTKRTARVKAKAVTDIVHAPCNTPVPGNAAAPFDTPVPPADAPALDVHAPCNTPVPVETLAEDDTAADAPVVDNRLAKAKQELEEAEKRCRECTSEHIAYVSVPGKRDAAATKDLYWGTVYPAMVDAMQAVDAAKQRVKDLEQC